MRNFKLRPDLAIDFDGRKLFRIEAVCDYTMVCDKAMVYGNAWVCDYMMVCNDAYVYAQGSMRNE